jgi:DNA-binding CsgD family transcriptional regulator
MWALSASESDVVRLVLGGRSNETVARLRGTSARTVANLLARAFRKLGVGSRAELAAAMLDGSHGTARAVSVSLSRREKLVVSRVAAGHSNKRIAYELDLAVSTVASYVARAAAKLGARSRIDLVRAHVEMNVGH